MATYTSNINLFKWNTSDSSDLNSKFDIDVSLNDNWDKIDTAIGQNNTDIADLKTNKANSSDVYSKSESDTLLNNKVDKVSGKDLSTNDYTTAEKTKLSGIETGATKTTIDSALSNTSTNPVQNKVINAELGNKVDKVDGKGLSTNDYTDEDKTKVSAIDSLQESSEDLDVRVTALERKTGKVYGIKRKITDNTATTWERIEDNTGLVANANKATTSEVQNDFDSIYPWSEIKSCNVDTDGNIVAYIDEPGFAFDGSNGEVMTRIPTLWFKREIITDENNDDWEYIYIADYQKEGFNRVNEFLLARYNLSYSDSKAHSMSGVIPKYNTTLANFRNYAKATGDGYCLMDWRIFILQMLYLVEYADYNSQSTLGQGIVAYSSAKAIVAEENTNRIIVSTVGTGLWVGKTICIGTTAAWNAGVAQDRKITSIEDYSDDEVSGKAIYFDGDAVNIVIDNMIWGSAQETGECDSLGMNSGCLINNGYHSVIYRGIENIFGHIWQHIDGINIKDYQAYICYNPESYANDKFTDPYKAIGYMNAQTTDSYIKELGYDKDNPAVALPVTVNGSSSTCVADNYWCSSGNRIAYLGGTFSNYWAKDGFFAWACNNASSYSAWNYGARLLKYQ